MRAINPEDAIGPVDVHVVAVVAVERFGIDTRAEHCPSLQSAYSDRAALGSEPVQVEFIECELPALQPAGRGRRRGTTKK